MTTATLDEMKQRIGTETVGDWVEVTQAMIDKFADATGDHQFIHVDPVMAAATPFGGTIAHGFLTLSLMPLLWSKVADAPQLEGARMGVNSGAKVRGRFRLLACDEKTPGQYQQTTEFTVEIAGAPKPAMIAEWISQIFV